MAKPRPHELCKNQTRYPVIVEAFTLDRDIIADLIGTKEADELTDEQMKVIAERLGIELKEFVIDNESLYDCLDMVLEEVE